MSILFDKVTINGMEIKNRFVRSATWEGMADDQGHPTERLLQYYEELAKGGAGLIITGYAYVLEEEKPSPKMLGIYNDAFISEYQVLTDLVHRYGSKIAMQIAYGGTQTTYQTENRIIWGPSNVAEKETGVIAQEMSKEDINTLIKAFGKAAARAKAANFDAVQIHAAHGYLLSQFLTPYHNRRKDEYGGSIANRARIIFAVYDEIRSAVGPDFPVLIKINCADFIDNGLTFAECLYVCKELSRKGIDAIEVSGGIKAAKELSFYRKKINSPEKEAYFKQEAAAIAAEVNTPVILVGGLRSLEVIEEIAATTKISMFALSRPLIAEPDLIKRWQAGERQKAKCRSCNECRSPEGVICIFNRNRQPRT